MTDKTVYILHAIDAEGPLAEAALSINAPEAEARDYGRAIDFDRVSDMRELILGHRGRLLGSWEEIIRMLRVATSDAQRRKEPDSFGGGWVYNWFCLDHVGFLENPRRRTMGFHQTFDFYTDLVRLQAKSGDEVHWHFHPMSTYRVANKCATSYLNSPELYETLCRRIIERQWFPRVHRAGFQDERPDSHWFLEQWIPFDISNTATKDIPADLNQDLQDGRFSDWRWAPDDWRTYRPSHDCYQKEGNCRRRIGRCLNLLNRFANLDESELRRAFARAQTGSATLVGLASHDFRDLNVEVDYVRYLLKKVVPDYKGVRYKFVSALEGFRAIYPPERPALDLKCTMTFNQEGHPVRLEVGQRQGRIFGPQPFLAIRTRSNRFIHDNLNYGRSLEDFNYQFDDESVWPDDVRAIGIAANDEAGNQCVRVLDVAALKDPRGTIEF